MDIPQASTSTNSDNDNDNDNDNDTPPTNSTPISSAIPENPSKNQQNLDTIWSNHVISLRAYQTQHGHVRVPRKSGPLGEWVRAQRRYNKLNQKGQATPLTKERIDVLNELGFIWFPAEDGTGKRKRLEGGEQQQQQQQQQSQQQQQQQQQQQPPLEGGTSGIAHHGKGISMDSGAELDETVWTPAQKKAHEAYRDQIQLLKRAEKSVRDAEKALEVAKKRQKAALAKKSAIESVLTQCSQDVLVSELEGQHHQDDWITMYKRLGEYKERIGNIRFPRGWEKELEKSFNVTAGTPESKRRKTDLEDSTAPNNFDTTSNVGQDGALMMLPPSLPEIGQTQVEFMSFPDLNATGEEAIVTHLHDSTNSSKPNMIDLDGPFETKNEEPSLSDLDLYVWVTRMRKMPKKQLKHWRRQALDQLGFVWHQYDATWSDRYQELIAFKREHGHTQVPTVHSNLGVWVGTQRKQYTLLQQNKPSHMTTERMQLLNDIGFLWKVNAWDVRFEELKSFREVYGHFQIPAHYPNKKLRPWITTQRSHYRFRQEGKASQITRERIKALESIGFVWKTREDWQTRYEELVEYFKRVSSILQKI